MTIVSGSVAATSTKEDRQVSAEASAKCRSGRGESAPNYVALRDRACYEGPDQDVLVATDRMCMTLSVETNRMGSVKGLGPFGSDFGRARFEVEYAFQRTAG